MKRLAVIFLLAFFPAVLAHADIYKWVDKDGTLHLTDDMHKVPQEFRRSIEVIKTVPLEEGSENGREGVTNAGPRPGIFDGPAGETAPVGPGNNAETQSPELYGDYPIDWWINAFNQKNREIETLEKAISERREYVSLFDSGRRFGQTYDAEKTDQYRKFKADLPEDETNLARLKDELSELRRKARTFGVPKEVRGE